LAIDGEPVEKLADWWATRTSAATRRIADVKVWPAGGPTRGTAGSVVTLRVRSAVGETDVPLKREPAGPWKESSDRCCLFRSVAPDTPAWRRIGDIGVIELSQIRDKAAFDRALESLSETRGLVLHGDPGFGGGPTELARRIIRTPLAGPRYWTPLVLNSKELS